MARPRTTLSAPLTARQRKILRWLVNRIVTTGQSPTHHEIVDAFGFSGPNAAVVHLTSLRRKGYLELPNGDRKSRSFRVPGLKVVVEFTDDEAGRRLAAALAPDDALTPAA